MDENDIAEVIKFIDELIDVLDAFFKEYESLSDPALKLSFLESNLAIFGYFKDSLFLILLNYQFKEPDNPTQNTKSDTLRSVISKILAINDFFEHYDSFKYFKSDILDCLSKNEGDFAHKLQFDKSMPKIKIALQYFQDRDTYKRTLQENNYFEGQDLNSPSAKSYISNGYERCVLGHSLKFLRDNLNDMSLADIEEIFKYANNSPFFDDLLSKINGKLSDDDELLVTQYIEFILKLKSLFMPSKIKDDKFVQAMWNGKITNNKFLSLIAKNTPLRAFDSLMEGIPNNSDDNTLENLATHFKEHGLSYTNISYIVYEILSGNISYECIAELLAEIDLPLDFQEFTNGKHFKTFAWLITGPNPLSLLLKKGNNIKYAEKPFLPATYYVKILDRLFLEPNKDEHFLGNLYTLLRTDYFSEEEKQAIQERLDANNLNSPYKVDCQIVFEGNESYEDLCLKIKQAYSSGQTIPLSIAQNIFNSTLSVTISPDSLTLQACVQSTICNILASMGITDEYQVFFGKSNNENGYQISSPPHIWINSHLLAQFINESSLESKTKLFETISHECNHAWQDYITANGDIDFLGYNWTLENTIRQYDSNFYPNNYKKIFIESDSRKKGILGHLHFLHGLNPSFAATIRQSLEEKYFVEATTYSLSQDSKKEFAIGDTTITIDVSDYVGYLIKDNPSILTETPILNIGYHQDGSQKSIDVLLDEFEKGTYTQDSNPSNIYSIYDGLISKELANSPTIDDTLQEKIHHFKSQAPCSASMKAVQNIAESVSPEYIANLFDRMQSFTLFPKIQSKEVDTSVVVRG